MLGAGALMSHCMPVKGKKRQNSGDFTPERARRALAVRDKLAAEGKIKLGRPKGVLGVKEQAKIKSRETFIEVMSTYGGRLADNLIRASDELDTRATIGALDRIGVIAVQKVEHDVKFSLVGLQTDREKLNAAPQTIDGNPAMRIIEAGPEVEEDEA